VVAWRFHVGAYKALKRGAANMDVLVSLGTNASYFYSVMSVAHHHLMVGVAGCRCSALVAGLNGSRQPWSSMINVGSAPTCRRACTPTCYAHMPCCLQQRLNSVQGHHMTGAYRPTDFFEMCAMLITFIIFGKFLEAMAKGRTSAALAALARLSPATALLIAVDAAGHVVTEEEVATSLLQRGDLLKVRHAQRRMRPRVASRAASTQTKKETRVPRVALRLRGVA